VEVEPYEASADATIRGDELLDDAHHGGLDVDGAIGVARVETFLQSGISDDCRQKRMEGYQEQQHHVRAARHAALAQCYFQVSWRYRVAR